MQQQYPWQRRGWKPIPGKWPIFLYVWGTHILALIGICLYGLPSLKVFLVTASVMFLGGLGTTVVYHRCLTHLSVNLNWAVKHFLILCAEFNGGGSPLSWKKRHEYHHRHTDTPLDVSSPHFGGFWWSHWRWLYQTSQSDLPDEPQEKDPELGKAIYRFWEWMETPIILVSLFCGLLYGWEAFFWFGPFRLAYILDMQCFVNSLTHMGKNKGPGVGGSINVFLLGPFQLGAWGENWHGNHHKKANSARLGWQEWWQVDVGWCFIWLASKVRLAWDVRT